MTGWTTGGQNRALAVQNVNFRVGGGPALMPAVPDGSWFAAVVNGPGSIGVNNGQIDGNGTNDFDLSELNRTVTF
ncbi:MAG: hypothetical protein KDK91_33835, partial [Gammaproteobacteria bacterium]|nr:hypothetical protein [Gammaproteobacteria bacterium]